MDKEYILELLNGNTNGNGSVDWAALREEWGFDQDPPDPPETVPEPVKPEIPPPPREEDEAYEVSLTGLDRLIGARRRKKETASLRRFERDRKAWDEDRLNALAIYEFALKTHRQHMDAGNTAYAAALSDWKSSFRRFLEQQDEPA